LDALRAIVSKRDSRSFTDQAVDEETLRRVLQAGRMAGSAKNTQPCRFVVLTDRTHKEELAACGQFSKFIPEAAVYIAVIVPELVETRWYHFILHNQTAAIIKAYLLFSGFRRVVVINVPWYLSD